MGPARPRGHVRTPHTADLRIEAWALTREACVAESVCGPVGSFADVGTGAVGIAATTTPVGCTVSAPGDRDDDADADLLAAVLEEVIYRLDAHGQAPLRTSVVTAPAGGWHVEFAPVGTEALVPAGAVPKAVSLQDLHVGPSGDGWRCGVTIDV